MDLLFGKICSGKIMGNLRIFIIVSFCMTSLSILPLFAGIPHTAYGVVEYSDASNPSAISFNAFITY